MTSRVGRTALAAAAVPLAMAMALAGCTSSGSSESRASGSSAEKSANESTGTATGAGSGTSAAGGPGTVASVDCPGKAKAVPLPAGGIPAPLPQKVVVVDVRGPVDGRTVVTGVVPAAERDVLAQLQSVYPNAGFSLSGGETEARDAESNFESDTVKGRWSIRELSDCSPVATRIDLVFTSTG